MNKPNFNKVSYKEWIGISAAPVFWIASLICFIFGLAFKQGTGILVPGTNVDILIFFSIGLGLANTAIQIVGNDSSKEELGIPLWLMWIASYFLGIGSNVNFLNGVIQLENQLLQFMVCWGLGVMVEVAPERLLVRFLRAAGVMGTSEVTQTFPVQRPSVIDSLPKRQNFQSHRDGVSALKSSRNQQSSITRDKQTPPQWRD